MLNKKVDCPYCDNKNIDIEYLAYHLQGECEKYKEINHYKIKTEATHKISAVYYPRLNEVELTWENISTGDHAGLTAKVTPKDGGAIAHTVAPCVYQGAVVTDYLTLLSNKQKPLRKLYFHSMDGGIHAVDVPEMDSNERKLQKQVDLLTLGLLQEKRKVVETQETLARAIRIILDLMPLAEANSDNLTTTLPEMKNIVKNYTA